MPWAMASAPEAAPAIANDPVVRWTWTSTPMPSIASGSRAAIERTRRRRVAEGMPASSAATGAVRRSSSSPDHVTSSDHGQRDRRAVPVVVDHLLVGRAPPGGAQRVLARAGVAGVARVGAAGDLHADPVAGLEAVRGGPQVEPHGGDAVG